MVQTTLDRYFVLPPKPHRPGLTFLDLPPYVREKIYIFAGITYRDPLSLNGTSSSAEEDNDGYEEESSRCSTQTHQDGTNSGYSFPPDICRVPMLEPLQLLLVSRKVSEEVSFLLYSRNRFQISRSSPGGLSALRRLRPSTLATLSWLHIILNASKKKNCFCRNPRGPLLPHVSMQSRNHRIFIDEWTRTCIWLSSHTRESHLRLAVICDTNSDEFAQEIIKPLKLLPTLADFGIRLYPGIDPVLDAKFYPLVTATALEMTGRSPSPKTKAPRTPAFNFADLPREIQDRILEFTDLVAPFDLSWTPKLGLRSDYYRRDINCCSTCSVLRDPCCWPQLRRGIFTAQCSLCWRFPLPLFLVNRSTYQAATRVFYSLNHFKILPYGGRFEIETDKYMHLAPFISSISQNAVKYLRSVQFVFAYQTTYLSGTKDGYTPWDEMVDRLKQYSTMSTLRITLDMSESRLMVEDYQDEAPTMEEEDTGYRTHYRRLVKPFADLDIKPKDFFVHLSWPMYGSTAVKRCDRWEKNLETMAMGEDYGSSTRGKFDVPGRWRTREPDPEHHDVTDSAKWTTQPANGPQEAIETRLFINDQFQPSSEESVFKLINPFTRDVAAEVHQASEKDVTYFAEAGWTVQGTSSLNTPGHLNLTPYGVAACIITWNPPLAFFALKIAPALAAGNTVVLKSSEKASLTPALAAKLIVKAGFPPGVVNVLSGFGTPIGTALASHMDIRCLSFTGSSFTGQKIQAATAASSMKVMHMKLGGKSPAIIFDDTDLESAAEQTQFSIQFLSGQTCMANSHIYVQETVVEKFLALFKSKFGAAAP